MYSCPDCTRRREAHVGIEDEVGNAGQRPADRDELGRVIALSVVVARRGDRSLGRTVRVQPTNVPGVGRAEEPVGLG